MNYLFILLAPTDSTLEFLKTNYILIIVLLLCTGILSYLIYITYKKLLSILLGVDTKVNNVENNIKKYNTTASLDTNESYKPSVKKIEESQAEDEKEEIEQSLENLEQINIQEEVNQEILELKNKNQELTEKEEVFQANKKAIERLTVIEEFLPYVYSYRDKVKDKSNEYKKISKEISSFESYIHILNGFYVSEILLPVYALFEDTTDKYLLERSKSSIVFPWDKKDYSENINLLTKASSYITALENRKVQQIPNAYIKKSTTFDFIINNSIFQNKEIVPKLTNIVDSLLICVKILEQGVKQLAELNYDYSNHSKSYGIWDDSLPLTWINKMYGHKLSMNTEAVSYMGLDHTDKEEIGLLKEEIEVYYNDQSDYLDKVILEAPNAMKKSQKIYFSYVESVFIKVLNSLISIHKYYKESILPLAITPEDKEVLVRWEDIFVIFENILYNFMKNKLNIHKIEVKRGDDLNFDLHNPYEEARYEEGLDKDKIIEVVNPGYEYVSNNVKASHTHIIKMTDVIVSK